MCSRIFGETLEFCQGRDNTLQMAQGKPGVGRTPGRFARGDDPIYEGYKEHVGLFGWTPVQIFRRTCPDSDGEAGDLTIIVWILPQASYTKRDTRTREFYPAS